MNKNNCRFVWMFLPLALSGCLSIPVSESYNLSVTNPHPNEICNVSTATGSTYGVNINNVTVSCSSVTYTVGGNVMGLNPGERVVLLNNGENPIGAIADGEFIFPTPIIENGTYSVTIAAQPTGKSCAVSNGSGTAVGANISNVQVICSARR